MGGTGGAMGGMGGMGGAMGGMGGGSSAQLRRQSGTEGEEDYSMLSPRGTVVVDARTNTLIVRETAQRLEEIRKLIAKLDLPVRQVMIESRIVIAANTFARDLGVRFGVTKQAAIGSGKSFAIGGAGTQSNANALPNADGNIGEISDQLVDLGLQAFNKTPYGALGMTLARAADYVLNLELTALQDEGRAEIVANPRVMTSDRCQARIKQGFEVPFQSSSGNLGTNIEFKEAELVLDVTPQITPDGTIQMGLLITKNEPDFNRAILGQPPIVTRQIVTNVQMLDGETVVLGGVFENTVSDLKNSIPFFGDIPGIGFLFRRNEKLDDKSELLIFVTPKIVHDNLASEKY